MTDILAAKGISKSFGEAVALCDVSLRVRAGEIRAICGENGAGKSTLVKILMGVYRADAGSVAIDGVEHDIRSSQQAQSLGLALVAQELSLAPHLSVLDNIWLGSPTVPLVYRRRRLRARARAALDALGAQDCDLDAPVGRLTLGRRQMVEIARLLARDARILILDEPTATLSDVEIERMMQALRALRAQGRAVLYITHRLGEVFEICDTATVLRNGQHVATQPVGGLTRERLIEQMLGRTFDDMYPKPAAAAPMAGGITVEHLSIPGVLDDFSMVAPRGKIVCIAGQVGSGATMATRALAGLVPGARGRVLLDDEPHRIDSAAACIARNVIFVSEDRAHEGLFHRPVLDNLVALRLGAHKRLGFLSWPSLKLTATRFCDRVRIDAHRLHSDAFDLSGGNQQKILFARALERPAPGVLIMNEPTHGIDVGARAEIYRLMREFCAQGFALIMTSSDLEEVVGMADVVYTLYRGRPVGRYERGVTSSRILADITHPAHADEAA